jgi:endonuclease/exonuclease/phosphatase family metal-dependent hydrolase
MGIRDQGSGIRDQGSGTRTRAAAEGGRDVRPERPKHRKTQASRLASEPGRFITAVLQRCLQHAALLTITAALVFWSGCATARNYTDPDGPIVVGRAPAPGFLADGGSVGIPNATGNGQAASILRIVTFNIEFGRNVEGAADLIDRSDSLRDADLLLLQELDGPGAEALARRLRMNYVYVPSTVHPASHRDFGVAILSPWPLTDVHKVLLPGKHALRKIRRSAAAATLHLGPHAVRAYAVHFETPFGGSDDLRRAQARAVLTDASTWSGPLVIGGDFNGTDAADEFEKAGLTWLTHDVHDTDGPFDLDHIVIRGLCEAAQIPAARGPAAPAVSDHRPVWAVVHICS